MAPHGLALIGEDELANAVATLLADGLIEAFEEVPGSPGGRLVRVDSPSTDAAGIGNYWFGLTTEGERVRSKSADLVEAYYNVHPPHRAS